VELYLHVHTRICIVHRCFTVRGQLKCDGTRAETRFRLSAKRTSPFKSAVASVQSNTGSRCVRISGSNAGYTMFRCSVKGTGYPLHSPVSLSIPLPCVTVCHHISTGVYSYLTNVNRVIKSRTVRSAGRVTLTERGGGGEKETLTKLWLGNLKQKRPL